VGSPRLAYGVRSNLLFDLLKRLHAANMPISKPSTMVLSTVPAQPEAPPISAVAAAPTAAPAPVPPLTS